MNALLVGYGGIGSNVYWPELQKLGYYVEVLDANVQTALYHDISQITKSYDIAVICTPNFTHETIARKLAETGTKQIFVEKPGVVDTRAWDSLIRDFPDTRFHVVKNNLYRDNYGQVLDLINSGNVIGVDISWLNDNRIPNPGSWFTTKDKAFGGVSRDLMPHLYCFAVKMFGQEAIENANFVQTSSQRWDLNSITSTDYGVVLSDGTYDVDDTATAIAKVNNISLRLTASWKEGYDKQSVTLFMSNGRTYEWVFGLCPAEAYGVMLQDTSDTSKLDIALHNFLEKF